MTITRPEVHPEMTTMMSQTIAQYDALWQSLVTRRRWVGVPQGLDGMAGRWLMRLGHARQNLSRFHRLAKQVDARDREYAALSDTQLDQRTVRCRETFMRRRDDEKCLVEALAALREVAWRQVGQKPFYVQLVGALAMYHGQIMEMKTGEGKTLTATLPATLLAWSRPHVHIVTANDYLAGRDAAAMVPIYRRAGVGCGCVLPAHSTSQRVAEYRKPIVYTTQKELVGDWLRDQIRCGGLRDAVTQRLASPEVESSSSRVLIPGLHAVIVDEADTVLIDEAVTPLIISSLRGVSPSPHIYQRGAELAAKLNAGGDFEVDFELRQVKLLAPGRRRLAGLIQDVDHGEWQAVRRRHELIEQALAAIHLFQRGEHYELVEDRVVMVDEFTGRFVPNRQWQHGVHQAIEAKEKVKITGDSRSLASLSFQRFFRFYPFLAGMTGTALGSRGEFEQTYGVPVRIIPTDRPVRRDFWPTQVFKTAEGRWQAVIESVAQLFHQGRPVLIGTHSVASSQQLSERLSDRGLPHEVLNAVHHEREAQVVAQAGRRGAITVATNMAGRGTDIRLEPFVAEMGGLHVILTEFNTASRIDLQLMGRAARQGDSGSCQAMVSLEDPLLIKHAPVVIKWAMRLYAHRDGRARSGLPLLFFKLAQRRAQRQAVATRRAVSKQDEWLDRTMPNR